MAKVKAKTSTKTPSRSRSGERVRRGMQEAPRLSRAGRSLRQTTTGCLVKPAARCWRALTAAVGSARPRVGRSPSRRRQVPAAARHGHASAAGRWEPRWRTVCWTAENSTTGLEGEPVPDSPAQKRVPRPKPTEGSVRAAATADPCGWTPRAAPQARAGCREGRPGAGSVARRRAQMPPGPKVRRAPRQAPRQGWSGPAPGPARRRVHRHAAARPWCCPLPGRWTVASAGPWAARSPGTLMQPRDEARRRTPGWRPDVERRPVREGSTWEEKGAGLRAASRRSCGAGGSPAPVWVPARRAARRRPRLRGSGARVRGPRSAADAWRGASRVRQPACPRHASARCRPPLWGAGSRGSRARTAGSSPECRKSAASAEAA
jgi:hypothetical protein